MMQTDIDALFRYWWRSLDRDGAISTRLGTVRFRALKAPRWPFMARVRPPRQSRPLTVEVSQPFLREIKRNVGRNLHPLATATLLGDSVSLDDQRTRELLIEGMHELAVSFLLLHELFHVCCGHIGWYVANRVADAASYDEVTLGMSAPAGSLRKSVGTRRSPAAAFDHARYREVEADGSAIQWIMRAPLPAAWQRLCRRICGPGIDRKTPILELEGRARHIAFAAVLNAVWLMTTALERGRLHALAQEEARSGGEARWQRRTTHPYPVARLLAATFTLFEQFAELTSRKIDADGMKSQTLSGIQAHDSRVFVSEVLRRSLVADWRMQPDVAGLGAALHPPSIVTEIGNLLRSRRTITPAGKQLERLQRLRRSQQLVYAPHRCLPRDE